MKKAIILLLVLLTLTSCATIISKKSQKVEVNSASNQVITVYDQFGNVLAKGKGTLTLELPKLVGNRKRTFIEFKTATETKRLFPYYNLAYKLGNAFIPFGIGYIVDNITGAGVDYENSSGFSNRIELK